LRSFCATIIEYWSTEGRRIVIQGVFLSGYSQQVMQEAGIIF
jgi:hypothetical protein